MIKKFSIPLSFLGVLILLSACLRPLQADPLDADVPAFVPPTLLPFTTTPVPTATPEQNPGLPQGDSCIDNLTFIEDESIPDGTVLEPGTTIKKGWKVTNSGTCNWGKGYTIRLIAGPALDAPSPQDLFPARSGTSLTIQIEYKVPENTGKVRSVWQAYNPSDVAFGDSFYLDIVVEK